MTHGSGDRLTSASTCLALMSCATSARLSSIDGMEIDRFRVQLTVSEHRPMPIDDLCGAGRPRSAMSDRISRIVSGVARLAVTIISPAWALCIIELSGWPSSWAIDLVSADIV